MLSVRFPILKYNFIMNQPTFLTTRKVHPKFIMVCSVHYGICDFKNAELLSLSCLINKSNCNYMEMGIPWNNSR